ncbi:KamA family radical SAM protein [Zooshikella sp. RANM57]|uniref:KamA family radical SAM protein n=1 Tax=Zooshikella sp. RANM57 TaxID=3425863 RepID=UPI003D6F4D3B
MQKEQRIKYYSINNYECIPQVRLLSDELKYAINVVGKVLPFRINNYVVDELIDWTKVPDDPMFKLSFLQRDFLSPEQFKSVENAIKRKARTAEFKYLINQIRLQLNPHPSGQLEHNTPTLEGIPIPGIQHKYQETVLVFPAAGQTCFTYCTFCFRWPQFTGDNSLKFASKQSPSFFEYIRKHKEVTDVLITGGDPMVMNFRRIESIIRPLLGVGFEHIQNIRIGSKVLSLWPYRFISDQDADNYLKLFEDVNRSGKHLAFMAHFNHWKELNTEATRKAVQRILSTGTNIRCQSPMLKHINDDAGIWKKMWQTQVQLGMIPYYMFIERDTGPKAYFETPLVKAFEIFRDAYQDVSGLARTVRGPSMSATPGKITIEGIDEIAGEKVIQLKFLQSRTPDWCNKIFFAQYDERACWFDELVPAFGKKEFFFESNAFKPLSSKRKRLDVTPASLSY